jgi:hypothetical protein
MDVPEIREYGEEYPVEIEPLDARHAGYGEPWNRDGHRDGRVIIRAWNEGRYNCTAVDLEDVLRYAAKHYPQLLDKAIQSAGHWRQMERVPPDTLRQI